MPDYSRIFIDGRWVAPDATTSAEVVNPATEEVIAHVPMGSSRDVDRAVAAARSAADGWARTPAKERAAALGRVAAGLQQRAEELAVLATDDVGTPIGLSRLAHAGLPLNNFAFAAQAVADSADAFEGIGNSRVVREPYGVVGAIAPWNYPMHQSTAKVAPALAAGNTVVLKPSEVAPLTIWALTEIIEAAGLPPGVFNLVSGDGPVVGQAIAAHPQVDLVSFTGSTAAGIKVSQAAAPTIKKVSLELGGKSPAIVLPGTDLSTTLSQVLQAAFVNSGQTCFALTRLLVHADEIDEAEELLAAEVAAMRLGDPREESTQYGPLASKAQRDRVTGYMRSAIDAGHRLLVGGPQRPAGPERGFYVQPTVFTRVPAQARITREEIFGPVLVVQIYRTFDEAVLLANDTSFGLAAGVWAPEQETALAVGRRVRAGQVQINGGGFNPNAPFGGYKQSGNGRENGRYGLEEFQEIKSFQL
ncbi:aldehyde dehydrogenase family protein [Streptomyces sp. NPDC058371]|uniref:aldehyde dehydrogenase family protein n=1 Tax=Streptomyces sp. NPDC058371 TaxID=3346463 RepID=UPI00364A558E